MTAYQKGRGLNAHVVGVAVLVALVQITDIKLYSVKVTEIIALLFIFSIIFSIKVIRKNILIWFCLIIFWCVSSFLVNLSTKFYLPSGLENIFKYPFFITLARSVELLICVMMLMASREIGERYNASRYDLRVLFVKLNAIFVVAILFMYVVDLSLHIHLVTQIDSYRLRGFFVEGGPFGLLCSALFILSWLISAKRLRGEKIIFFMALVLSQSKAGYILIVCYLIANYFFTKKLYKKTYFMFLALLFGLVLGFSQVGERIKGYAYDYNNIASVLESRSDDTSLIMGRIAAAYIGPKMFYDNPIFGVGLGNYSLVRNDPRYLGIFPKISGWDLTGLGIFSVLLECGLIGLGGFLGVYYYTILRRRGRTEKLIAFMPLFIFLLGAQIYLIYPWIIAGISFWNRSIVTNDRK